MDYIHLLQEYQQNDRVIQLYFPVKDIAFPQKAVSCPGHKKQRYIKTSAEDVGKSLLQVKLDFYHLAI